MDTQKLAILSFAQKENIVVDHFVETVMSSRRSAQKEQLAEMIVQQKSSTVGILVEQFGTNAFREQAWSLEDRLTEGFRQSCLLLT